MKDNSCELGLWESSGFKDFIHKNEELDEMHIDSRICPYHRIETWSFNKDSPIDEVKKEVYLKYALIYCINNTDTLERHLSSIQKIMESDYKPQSIYIIDSQTTNNQNFDRTKEFLQNLNISFRIKKTLTEADESHFVDEFVMTSKVKEFFYVCIRNNDFNIDFLKGLDNIINGDMEQVMFAGNEDYYFVPMQIHQLTKSHFQQYLESKGLHSKVYEYDKVCNS